VHQFQSPKWYQILKLHLASLALYRHNGEAAEEVVKTIVRLRRGEALIFCPKAYFDVVREGGNLEFGQLQDGYAKIMVRKKVTADGGRSILASDAIG
jgi:hypothetical protein